MTGLKRALWSSVGDGGKYGHVLFIKILISWRILEGQRAKTSPLASPRLEMALGSTLVNDQLELFHVIEMLLFQVASSQIS